MSSKTLIAYLLLFSPFMVKAQHHERSHSFVVGGGYASVLDTYLSPYSHTGPTAHLQRQTEREVSIFGLNHLRFQTLFDLDCAFTENPAGNVNEYAGGMRYALAWLKPLKEFHFTNNCSVLAFAAGPQISTYLGCVYNERNGNNPAQAKADFMIDLTAQAKWDFNLLRRRVTLAYQLYLPCIGLAFSENYGQSYYETFQLGNYDHNIVFAQPGNMPSMRHLLNLDIPVRKSSKTALRISYAGYFMQSTFNRLRYHSYTHSFMIGITSRFLRL